MKEEIKITEAHLLADKLHAQLCRLDHIDRCDYYYKEWGDDCRARDHWLSIAKQCLEITNFDVCVKIAEVLNNNKL